MAKHGRIQSLFRCSDGMHRTPLIAIASYPKGWLPPVSSSTAGGRRGVRILIGHRESGTRARWSPRLTRAVRASPAMSAMSCLHCFLEGLANGTEPPDGYEGGLGRRAMKGMALGSQPPSQALTDERLLQLLEFLRRRVPGPANRVHRPVVGDEHPTSIAGAILLPNTASCGSHGGTMPGPSSPHQTRPDFTDVAPARRRNMAAIRGKDTRPELTLRHLLHAKGLRYRLHAADLPGRPDIVLPRWRAVVLVNGCFFHRHGCSNSGVPKTRAEWWAAKLAHNVERDERNHAALRQAGWRVIVAWECEIRSDPIGVADRVAVAIGRQPANDDP